MSKVGGWVCVQVGVCEVARANTLTHQTPTCTPIILDGLAVKCVMWGSVVLWSVHVNVGKISK